MSNPCNRCRYTAFCLPEGRLPAIRIIKALRRTRGLDLRAAKDYLSLTVPGDCDWAKKHHEWIASANPAVLKPKVPSTVASYQLNFAEDIPAGAPVAIGKDGQIILAKAQHGDTARVVGILLEDVLSGAPCEAEIATHGIVGNVLKRACIGSRVFLHRKGGYAFSPPHQAAYIACLGYALTDTDLWLQIQDYGRRM